MQAIFKIALKNLRRNKLRTVMTVCGTGIGLSLFVVLMTIAQSVKFQIHHMIDSYGIDIAIQAGGAPNPISSRIAVEDIDRLMQIKGVRSASGFVVGSKRLSWNHYFVLLGADASDPVLNRFPIIRGHIFSDSGKEVMIGSLLAQKRGLHVNDTLHLDRYGGFLITGIFNTGSRVFDGAAFMGLPVAQQVLQRGKDVNLIVVRMAEGYSLKTVLHSIQENFPHLEVMRGFDFVSQIRVFRTVNSFAEAVALISLIACCITVTDTLLMAITERTKEIGILMTIGWSRWQIIWTILSESILICLVGSVLSNLFGTLFLWMMNNSRMLGIGWVPVWPSIEIVGMAIVLGMAMGCLSAVYPGVVASRMLPATALRFEK
jgi:putative ABC transport system permease protein